MRATDELFFLFILAFPIATIAWTITHEEILREARDWCKGKSETCRSVAQRKFFYLFTCEFCFSFYGSEREFVKGCHFTRLSCCCEPR